jgi:AP endonuclease-2
MGSDHCPISATFHSLKLRNNAQISSFASKFYSEFSGKQQKLVDLFKKQESVIITPTDVPAIKQNEPRKRINKAPKQTSLTSFLIKKPRLEVEKTDVNSTIVAIQSNNSPSTGATEFFQQINSQASAAWKQILKTPEIPLCTGHNERCVQRTVTKKGQHRGRQFWACSRGTGKSGDPNSNCNFFKWSNSKS